MSSLAAYDSAISNKPSYVGPERRSGRSRAKEHWLGQMLDQIDYAMLLIADEARVIHANGAARSYLDSSHPLQVSGGEVTALRAQDVAPVRKALAAASKRGLRALLALGENTERVSVAVVPLPAFGDEHHTATLLVFGKRMVCEELSAEWYSRSHGLTLVETQVLNLLCQGFDPGEVAKHRGVSLATIRTQIGNIRAKTGADSIRTLLRQVAVLPPLVNVLRNISNA